MLHNRLSSTIASGLEALIYQERRYAAFKHWLEDNHPEAYEEYIATFYTTIRDNSFEEILEDVEYTGCDGYPRYDN